KLSIQWEYIDKANGLGYPHTVNVAFSTDETLLCRAEAYVLSKEHNYAKALEDINLWIESHSMRSKDTGKDLTETDVNNYYNSLPYQPLIINKDRERSIKKKLNPEGFIVNPGTEENLIQLILQLRRLETLQEGLRWFDLKRYGIEFAHNRAGEMPVVLTKDDPRRAIQLPQDVITSGMEPNPRN
ncbi:lipoprotein, partial [gut metagenome]